MTVVHVEDSAREKQHASESLRLSFLTPKFHPERGGSETWSFNVLRSLADLGYTIEAIAGYVPGLPRMESIDGITVRRPGPIRQEGAIGRARWMRGFAPSALAQLRSFQPDVVLGHHSGLALAALLGRRLHVPSIGVVHDVRGVTESVRRAGILTGLARVSMLERSLRIVPPDAFIVPSNATADRVRKIARSNRPVNVVPVGADHGVLTHSRSAHSDVVRLVFVGRLVPEKGAGDVIAAVSTLHQRGFRIEASIIGDGPERERLQEQAKSLPVALKGWVSDEALDAEISDADLLLLPSTQEGWGLVLTEAAARGVPYVAYDIPAVREQHALLHAGLLVGPTSFALAEGVRALLADPSRRAALASAGREATKPLRWEASARQIVSIIEETVCARV